MIPPAINLIAQGFEIEEETVWACNGLGLKNLLQAGEQWLAVHVNIVNALNVFPVPDGDTGTNMLLTMRSAMTRLDETSETELALIARLAAQGALMGARGNSGVILSQLLQGMAHSLAGRPVMTAEDLARAVRFGVEQAYHSVAQPVEGTILTVARQTAEAARQNVRHNTDLVALLAEMVEAARLAQRQTPELLPVLKEAGVTDSGGQGWVYLLEGGLRFMRGQSLAVDETAEEAMPRLHSTLNADEEAYGYDVQFLIQGEALNVAEIRSHIDRLGWSTVVVGDERLVKVHVHTSDPGAPLSFGAGRGALLDVVVENMEEQARAFVHTHQGEPFAGPKEGVDIGVICVAPGEGLVHIFRSLGASRVLTGGQTMNPSASELLEAINQIKAEKVLILPNNSNIILAAQQAGRLSDKQVEVIPTITIPQGIAALLAFNPQLAMAVNAERMREAGQQAHTIEVTQAVRDSVYNGFSIHTGDVIGLLDNQLESVGQHYHEVVFDILSRLDMTQYEIITIYFGRNSSLTQAEVLAREIGALYPDLELEVHNGGQLYYNYIISLE